MFDGGFILFVNEIRIHLYTTSIIYLQFVAMLFFMGPNLVFWKMWKLWLSLKKWQHNFCQTDEETKVLKIQPQFEDWKDCKIVRLWACDQFSPWGSKHIPPIWCFYLIVLVFRFIYFIAITLNDCLSTLLSVYQANLIIIITIINGL